MAPWFLSKSHFKVFFHKYLFVIIIFGNHFLISSTSSSVFCPRAGPSLQTQESMLQFCRRLVFHRKLRNQGCRYARDWIGAVASYCFPCLSLFLVSEQTSKDPRGTNVELSILDLANWALRTSPKFTTGVKYQFHQGYWPYQRSWNPSQDSYNEDQWRSPNISLGRGGVGNFRAMTKK